MQKKTRLSVGHGIIIIARFHSLNSWNYNGEFILLVGNSFNVALFDYYRH